MHQTLPMTPDTELLRLYAEEGDENAFAEVVRRQVDLVYSTALRVVAGDRHLAQDVGQKVFTKMAEHAGRLCQRETLVGWLHVTTRNTAIKAIRTEQRRRAREQEVFAMTDQTSDPAASWEQLQPVLDAAISELTEPDRAAVLLRFFKNSSHREIGSALGLAEDTARKRVERALEKLRAHFARRGVTVSSTALASAMAEYSVQAAPALWAQTLASASLAQATPGGSVLLALLMSTKIKLALTALAVAILALVAVWKPFFSHPVPETAANPVAVSRPLSPPSPRPTVAMPVTPANEGASPFASASPASVAEKTTPAVAAGDLPLKPATANPLANLTPEGLRRELDNTIPAVIQVIESGDYEGFLMEFFPRDSLDEDAIAKGIRSNANYQKELARLPQALKKIQNQTPRMEIKYDEVFATFKVDPPVGMYNSVLFVRRADGRWYFGGPF